MPFQAKLDETQTQQAIALFEAAVRANGVQAARVAIPIIDSLSYQVEEYNQSLVEPPAAKPEPADHDAR